MPEHQHESLPTVDRLLRISTTALRRSSTSARLDAELLLAHAMGRNRVQLYSGSKDPVRPEVAARFITLVRERRNGRPVAQLVGAREFWRMRLTVTEDVLVPRPETELLVECALKRLPRDCRSRTLDLGTGAGAVALALAWERPNTYVTATDISEAALGVARYNASKFNIDNVEFEFGDWFGAVPGQRFTTVVSNPPYVTDQEWMLYYTDLAFEPRMALRGGADGLMAIRRIVEKAGDYLENDGWLLVEHGFRQGPAVADIFQAHGFANVCTYRDLPGHPRVTEGRLPPQDDG